MIKIIFVLVINVYNGGMTTIDFTTLQQCETAKKQVIKTGETFRSIGAVCIEKQIPIKKTKCKIVNDFSYRNRINASMAEYPYPVALECVEE